MKLLYMTCDNTYGFSAPCRCPPDQPVYLSSKLGFGSTASLLLGSELAELIVAGLQTGMPMTALSVLGGQFRLKAQTRAELYQDFLPWALRAGFRSADLMCLYYEKHFEVSHLAHC